MHTSEKIGVAQIGSKHGHAISVLSTIINNPRVNFIGLYEPDLNRRNELKKFNNFPFAVLYFTGSGAFNAKMRGNALKLGYSLNEYCLSDKDTKVEISPKVIKDKVIAARTGGLKFK